MQEAIEAPNCKPNLIRFRFGQAGAGDFGVAVGSVWDETKIYRLYLFAYDLFDDHKAFC